MSNPFAGLRAALFDLDGTLIETHIDFDLMRQEVARLARDFGVRVPAPRDILTGVTEIRDALTEAGNPEAAARFREEAFAALREIEVRQCGAPVEIPGAARLLEALEERGIAVGIVTRNCRPVSEMLLERGGLVSLCLVTRDDVPRTKPDPSHLLTALRVMDDRRMTDDNGAGNDRVTERDGAGSLQSSHRRPSSVVRHPSSVVSGACLMVGDHFMDVQSGRAAGMRTVGLLRGKAPSHFDICPPDLLVEGPADLLALLEANE